METNYIIGIDIGTTNVSVLLYDDLNKKVQHIYSFKNEFIGEDKTQNPDLIYSKVKAILDEIFESYKYISSIGLTGQMHGVLYLDNSGNAVSPLYTWQNEFAGRKNPEGITYLEEIKNTVNEVLYNGYGLATLYYHTKNGLLPINISSFASVMDYIGMKLTERTKPLVHSSSAASFGLFDLNTNNFKTEKIKALGINVNLLPEVTNKSKLLGFYKGVPVKIAIGDNQASVYGSLGLSQGSILLNYGTGSQISLICDELKFIEGIETRPYIENKYMLCGAALSGGRAYFVMEKFFRRYLELIGIDSSEQYENLNKLAFLSDENNLKVDTAFAGTRNEPYKKGSIINITEENFTPENLIYSTLKGMALELYEFYKLMNVKGAKAVASGNAVRKNKAFQDILSQTFNMQIDLPQIQEEAAFGAAEFSKRSE